MHLFTLATAPAGSTAGLRESLSEVGLNPFHLFLENMHRLDILSRPDELLDVLQQLHFVWAGIFVTVGLLSVINGYRWHKWIVITVAFLTGMGLGFLLSKSMESSLIIAACVGVLTAVVAWPLMKYAIAACGGLAGAFVGANVWSISNMPPDTYYAGALIGLVTFGLLSFILYRVVIVAMTCVAGAVVLVIGVVTLLMQVDAWQPALRQDFSGNPVILPLIVLVTAVIGFVMQQDAFASKPGAEGQKHGKPAVA
ncbi:MAG: hypothetical protein IT430_12675 [Phycisphaerales bacterium]|nr:hypothetical protein [Phycisphaerales bacterium]